MNIKLKNVKINNYKAIHNQSIDISNNITCIIGKNGSGKTTLLETVSNMNRPYLFNDVNIDSEKTFVIDVSDLEVSKEFGINQVEIVITMKGIDFEIISIKGIEKFQKYIDNLIDDYNIKYKKILKNNIEILNTYKKALMKYKDINIESDKYGYLNRHLNKLIKLIENINDFIDSKNNLNEYDYKKHHYFNNSLGRGYDWKYDHEIEISDRKLMQFKNIYGNFSIEENGYEYDWEKIEIFHKNLLNQINEIDSIFSKTNNEMNQQEKIIIDIDDDAYKIVKIYNNYVSQLVDECTLFFRKVVHISSADYKKNNGIKSSKSSEEIHILNLLNLEYYDGDLSKKSDGEAWMYYLARNICKKEANMIIIDEPGMFLNPVYQDRLQEVFEYLISIGKQLIYSTHVATLLPVYKGSTIYSVKYDGYITIKKGNYNNIKGNNKLIIGTLLIMAQSDLILVEGINDKLLIDHYVKTNNDIDESRFSVFDCSGHGILVIMEFCIEYNLRFNAIIDLDKKDKTENKFKDNYNRIVNNIEYVGTEENDEMEGFMDEVDYHNICEFIIKKSKFKMKSSKQKDHYKNGGTISEKLRNNLDKVFKNLNIV